MFVAPVEARVPGHDRYRKFQNRAANRSRWNIELTLWGLIIASVFGFFPSGLTGQHSNHVQEPAVRRTAAPVPASPDCQTVIKAHDQWLDGLGGALVTAASFNSISSPAQSDPFSDLSGVKITETVNSKTGEFNLNAKESPSSLAARWDQFRKELALSEGTRLTRDRALYLYDSIGGNCGKNLNLILADLDGLRGTDELNFHQARLDFVSYRSATLWRTSFSGAVLRHSDLSGSIFVECDFSGADLSGARLTGASFGRGTNLSRAVLSSVDLSNAYFEPSDVTDIFLSNATGLETLRFNIPTAAMKLRKILKDNGQVSEAREVTAAIFRNSLASEPIYSRAFSNYVQGGRLTHYGAKPWNAMLALLVLIPIFALVYGFALFSAGSSGIYVVHYIDGVLERNERRWPVRLRLTAHRRRARWDRCVQIARKASALARVPLYFSLLSAFQIGFHDFTVGTWISKLQSRPYSLKALGWVRTVVGIQALASVYLLALWVITYFANPFE
jgi:uncharacterized protein YjbI with pentapeptide repeats